ncbi:MAG: hypothetical protein AABY22_04220 [Nanoarchaeota archaeon]
MALFQSGTLPIQCGTCEAIMKTFEEVRNHTCEVLQSKNKIEDNWEEQFNEWSICKSWELDKDKFYLDATPEELKSFIHSLLQKTRIEEILKKKLEKMKNE